MITYDDQGNSGPFPSTPMETTDKGRCQVGPSRTKRPIAMRWILMTTTPMDDAAVGFIRPPAPPPTGPDARP
eukprot:11211986-Lingulodinium_polyedra.AAC.1